MAAPGETIELAVFQLVQNEIRMGILCLTDSFGMGKPSEKVRIQQCWWRVGEEERHFR